METTLPRRLDELGKNRVVPNVLPLPVLGPGGEVNMTVKEMKALRREVEAKNRESNRVCRGVVELQHGPQPDDSLWVFESGCAIPFNPSAGGQRDWGF